jgi:RNA polymerase sigma factor (sigma-70 family)
MGPRTEQERVVARFEVSVLPHMDPAYNLARWLTRNEHDAEDLVQESLLRAFQAFQGFRGTDGRAWLLAIVRNVCFTWLRRNRRQELTTEFDEEVHTLQSDVLSSNSGLSGHTPARWLEPTVSSNISITWGASHGEHAIAVPDEGRLLIGCFGTALGDFTSQAPRLCTTSGSTTVTLTPGGDNTSTPGDKVAGVCLQEVQGSPHLSIPPPPSILRASAR